MSPKHLPLNRITGTTTILKTTNSGLHATEVLIDPLDTSPDNRQELHAELLVARSIGATMYVTPENRIYAVSFPFPAYPKHSGDHGMIPAIPSNWRLLTMKHG